VNHSIDATGRYQEESELADRDMIRRWQTKPPEQRTDFLRVRISIRSSSL
jgi:hypothetical protein